MKLLRVIVALSSTSAVAVVTGFVPSTLSKTFVSSKPTTTQLHLESAVIKGEELGSTPFDEGQGGVRLAQETAVQVSGTVVHKPGKADPDVTTLKRYNNVVQLNDDNEETIIKSLKGGTIVATGFGQEVYQDPGETVEANVLYAPMEAAKDALNAAGAVKDATKLVFNFLGGNDLQLMEVLDAMTFMVKDALDVNTRAKISFHSLSYKDFPDEQVTLTLVAFHDEEETNEQEEEATAKSGIDAGEVYFRDGKYYTLSEDDINTALA